jgi:hypothetical protein
LFVDRLFKLQLKFSTIYTVAFQKGYYYDRLDNLASFRVLASFGILRRQSGENKIKSKRCDIPALQQSCGGDGGLLISRCAETGQTFYIFHEQE